MMTTRLFLVLLFGWVSLATAGARVFDTEQQYVSQYGANLNKGVPAPPPYKFVLFRKKHLRILVLFNNQISQGEVISKPTSRLTDADVTGVLAANQGSSNWKKEKVETTKDPNAQQMSLWSRKDGKLFAGYITNVPVPYVPYIIIGTRSAGDFLMKQKDHLASYVKE
jgi:hypothetical protein